MDWAKASILAVCLVLPASFGSAIAADQTTEAKPAETKPTDVKPADVKPTDTKPTVTTKASDTKSSDDAGRPALSKGEIRKLDAKCPDEADAKHLHG